MTVDWTNWLTKTAEEQRAIWAAYRAIIRKESDDARTSNYARMEAALRWPTDWRHRVRLTHG